MIKEPFEQYQGNSEDACIARISAKIEAMCYKPVEGSSAVNPRWNRVEDTIAFAKMMGYKKIGIATCMGLLAESDQLVKILKAQDLEPVSVCGKDRDFITNACTPKDAD